MHLQAHNLDKCKALWLSMFLFLPLSLYTVAAKASNSSNNPICDINLPVHLESLTEVDELIGVSNGLIYTSQSVIYNIEHDYNHSGDDDDDESSKCDVAVQADATTGGDGTLANPYNSLYAAEVNSQKGDTICVLPSENSLNGGIILKRNQKLIGLGPSVTDENFDESQPHAQISNTTADLDGNAVILDRNNKVKGIRFFNVNKSAIVAKDVKTMKINGNYFTQFNLNEDVIPLNLLGFQEFSPKPAVLILGTGNNKAKSYLVKKNIFTNSESGGIYVLQCDKSFVNIKMKSNKLTNITAFPSDVNFALQYYAIAVQTYDDSVNYSIYNGNYMDNIGFEISNSDALSVIAEDRSKQVIRVKNHVYLNTDGVGGISSDGSAVGIEFLMPASAESSELDIKIKDSTVDTGGRYGVAGIQYNFLGNVQNSSGSSMKIVMDRVAVIAGYLSVNINVLGLANQVDMLMKDTTITGFAEPPPASQDQVFLATGFDVYVSNSFGFPAKVDDLNITLKNTTIDRSQEHAIDFIVESIFDLDIDIGNVNFDIRDSSFTNSLGSNVTVFNFAGPLALDSLVFDFGGGSLNSPGRNSILGGPLDLLILNYSGGTPIDIDAQDNWWGTPLGLDELNRVFIDLPDSGSIDASNPLAQDPN